MSHYISYATRQRTDVEKKDNRSKTRALTQNEAVILTHTNGEFFYAILTNISETGVGLILNGNLHNISQDAEFTVHIPAGSHKLTRIAKICFWKSLTVDSMQLGLQFLDHTRLHPNTHLLDIDKVKIDPACALKIPANIAIRRKVLPFLEMNGVIHIASCNIKNTSMAYTIERMMKAPVCFWEVEAAKLEKILQQVYGNANNQAIQSLGKAPETANETINLSDKLLYAAYIRKASDIHIDPTYQGARIRFRVDGQLEVYEYIKTENYTELASRLKVMAGLDIAEKRAPQDGRFSHQFVSGGSRIDIRVATLPTKYGERITMRLLAVQTESLTLDNLGFTPQHQKSIEQFLRRTQGLMIMTGPTGSGKTTTLYAAIRMLLAERRVNIITVEDPIEYEMDGVAQVEIDATSDKVDFAKALRSILRHDPDVVMLGEIRDKETADIAIKAALTGHMVLGTLHTNSAAATVTRLIDMGVEPYLIAAALRLAVAQRLLRRLCGYCRIPRQLSEVEALAIYRPELSGHKIYEACGCVYCGNKGYAGRIGLYEILELNAEWARDITSGKGEAVLTDKMRATGVNSLLEDAILKMINGETSFAEVIQIAASW